MISPAELDQLMHQGWPGLVNIEIDGWMARMAEGVTARANSVLPVRTPSDFEGALRQVEDLYREHAILPAFQISSAAQPNGLDELLEVRGYLRRSPTLVLAAASGVVVETLGSSTHVVAIGDEPDEDWMDLWWSVDGRGGGDARVIARSILLSGPALYARSYDSAGVVAVGRLALIREWGGVYCMAVRKDARRCGYGRAILAGLLAEGERHGVERAWLQVVETNEAARALYGQAGFRTVSGYHYRVCPPQLSHSPDS